jgi:MoaA/NifB/PqqE/SkfB family radical SAM enzyme/SAM-dependent methyltransferase
VTPLTVNGRVGSIYKDSLHNLWNAPEIVQVRAAMARGEKPEACRLCWEREAAGGASRRLITNAGYRHLGGRLAIEGLVAEGAASAYVLDRKPDWFILEMGNACNLKCRSCSGLYSSRIAADSVHDAWTRNPQVPVSGKSSGVHLRLAPDNTPVWFKDIDAVADMIASGADGNAILSLMGGEPFLIDSTWNLLSVLVDRGIAQHFFVGIATNGQQRSAELERLAPFFRGFGLTVSIDGYGKLYEYLRHGANWRNLVENLHWFLRLPNLQISVLPTLQNYNVLDMVSLLRFVDEEGLSLGYNVLSSPTLLHPANLPPNVRRIAIARLRDYLDRECRTFNVAVVRAYCDVLERAGDSFDAKLLDEFMTFTNDLDASRGESLKAACPELVALIRAAGVEWSSTRRHAPSGPGRSLPPLTALLQRVNRTVSSHDATFKGFEAGGSDVFFSSAVNQIAEIDVRLREHGHAGLASSGAVADFACHYGRMTRALRAALPHAAVYACDIDPDAVEFCAEELGALPVLTGWRPDEDFLPRDLDAVICVSLLTHTPLTHWRRAFRAWSRMLRPGGVAAFTFLSDSHIDAWLAGAMEHYGSYPPELRNAAARALREEGHGFAPLPAAYGEELLYGVAFATVGVVRREVEAAGFDTLAIPTEAMPIFGQDLVLVRKRDDPPKPHAEAPAAVRDVTLVALYDPRSYAPADGREGSFADSTWARLAMAQPPRALPTDLGFGDPRVVEVREAQAAMAREHGVDSFCYRYSWGAAGPRWDAPWRDLVASGRPDFPFCLMIDVEGAPVSREMAGRLFESIVPGLRDRRYLCVEGRKLLVVRDVMNFVEPLSTATAWRAAAASAGIGGIHLCAAGPLPAERPGDLGFDSFLEGPGPATTDRASAVGAALTRPWPKHRFFQSVACRRDRAEAHSLELYEHWLRSTVDATRRRGESLVFVDSWNDWLGGQYLEPDDQDGRAALLATRRAARGPASGLVLLRQLRDLMGDVRGRAGILLRELGQVLALHEHTRDRLLASVEAALGRNPVDRNQAMGSENRRWVPVASSHLPPSGGGFSLDSVGTVNGEDLWGAEEVRLSCDEVRMAGWAHPGTCLPNEVDLLLALESLNGTGDRIVRVMERVARPDVVAVFPHYSSNCGFDTVVDLVGLPSGPYRVAIVQRTPGATYRDATPVTLEIGGARCSNV